MKYVLLIHGDEVAMGSIDNAEARAAMYQDYEKFTNGLVESGILRGGEELQPTSTATTVRMRDGVVLTTDGPFTETKEQLGGFYLIECENLDQAIEAASQVPSVKYGGVVEVRPVVEAHD